MNASTPLAVMPAYSSGQIFTNNQFSNSADGQTLAVIDPSSATEFARIARGNHSDIGHAVACARAAFDGHWGRYSALQRGRLLLRLALRLEAAAEELALIESRDTGKPLTQARADAQAVARYFEYYAGAADKLHGETIPYLDGYTILTLREPFGVTGHIIPWNYPLQIFGRSVGAALAAGNACVVKPSEDACLSVLRVAELAAEVGFPPGALNIVPGLGGEAGVALASHPGIDHISFTGSPLTGTAVTQAAAVNHTPVTLELGGKSPQVVFADADLDQAIPVLVNAIVQNAGQTCSAGSRVLIEGSAYERVLARLADSFTALRVGPPDMDLDCGPLIRASQLARVREFLADADAQGIKTAAQALLVPEASSAGFYVAPTLLRDVPAHSRLAHEEVFGPVLAAMSFTDEADAIRLANDTPFGLVAAIWTHNGSRQMRLAHAIRAGQVFINNYGAGGGVELPFGGYKHSGHGREKGFEGLKSFTTIKTVAIRHG